MEAYLHASNMLKKLFLTELTKRILSPNVPKQGPQTEYLHIYAVHRRFTMKHYFLLSSTGHKVSKISDTSNLNFSDALT